jgi:nucleoside-diphosphate-sugar epimerase
MRVCISGVAGFIGGHLAEALLRDGHQVSGLVVEHFRASR